MSLRKSSKSLLDHVLASHRAREKKRRRSIRPLRMEALEERALLAGIDVDASTFKISKFEANVHEQVGDPDDLDNLHVVGYSYSLSQREDGFPFEGVTAQDGVGFARADVDGELERNLFTQHEIASVTKPITAAAILQILENQATVATPIGDLLDQTIDQFLPASWTLQPWVSNITIRELLSHRSGMGQNETGAVRSDTNLMARLNTPNFMAVEPDPTAATWGTSYTSTNYALFRVALPYIWNLSIGDDGNLVDDVLDPVDNGDPTAVSNLPAAIQSAIAEDFDLTTITQPQLTAGLYKYYVAENVLEAASIFNANTINIDPDPDNGVPEKTLLYTFPGTSAGIDSGDQTPLSGSRGWVLNALELDRFVSVLRYTESILSEDTRDLMLTGNLGWRVNGVVQGTYGTYFGHDGVTTFTNASLSGQTNTQVTNYPNNVQATLMINSSLGPNFGMAFDIDGVAGVFQLRDALNTAYENAWTDVVYDGDATGDDDPADVFTLQVNPTNSAWIDLVHDGSVVLTRRADTLDSLTINGLGGLDVYNINTLPANMELIINGGDDEDFVFLGDGGNELDTDTPGVLDFDGAGGADLLRVDDGGEDQSNQIYGISNSLVTRSLAGPGTLQYGHQNVEFVTLNASNQNDIIGVTATSTGPAITVNARDGNDFVNGGGGGDILNGEEGGDVIFGGGGADIINGGDGGDTIDGEGGHDVIDGGENNDTIDGGKGNDTINGGGGDDTINGDEGSDDLFGELGEDTISGGPNSDFIVGGFDNDTLFGDDGNDFIIGGLLGIANPNAADLGSDRIDGGAGHDSILGDNGSFSPFDISYMPGGNDDILGGPDNDTIYAQGGNDRVQGNEGEDTIFGMAGSDLVFGGSIICDARHSPPNGPANGPRRDGPSRGAPDDGGDPNQPEREERREFDGCFDEFREPKTPNQVDPNQPAPAGVPPTAVDGADHIEGGSEGDLLYGDNWSQPFEEHTLGGAADDISGGDQHDILFGQVGGDKMHGDDGKDVMLGGADADNMDGGPDDDWMAGQTGDDEMSGDGGIDTLDGGADNDTLRGGANGDELFGRDGSDSLFGEGGGDTLDGGDGADNLSGDDGDDTLRGGAGADGLIGGPGEDVLMGNGGNDVLVGGNFGPVPESDDDDLRGGPGNDILIGDTLLSFSALDESAGGDDVMRGGGGRDTLYGQVGDDTMRGGFGADVMYGGAGIDDMRGNFGADEMHGEDGNDQMHGGPGDDKMFGDEGNDVMRGGGGGDKIFGGPNSDTILAMAGNDVVQGGGGADVIDGGTGNDTLNGNAGNDLIRGGDHDDELNGGRGDDILLGEGGDDGLSGGGGRDILIGGRNADALDGGRGQDILIGGVTDHDANDEALRRILAEWISSRSFNARVLNIMGIDNPQFANRENAKFYLIPSGPGATVHGDDAVDSLFGGTDRDWFLPDALDNVLDATLGDLVTSVFP